MMSTHSNAELPFSPDFAARVLTHANVIRRRRRAVGAGGAVAMGAIAVAMSVFVFAPARHAVPAPMVANVRNVRIDVSASTQTDPLQFLFPDAAPVAQFASSYSERIYGRQRQPGELLFADEMEETGDL